MVPLFFFIERASVSLSEVSGVDALLACARNAGRARAAAGHLGARSGRFGSKRGKPLASLPSPLSSSRIHPSLLPSSHAALLLLPYNSSSLLSRLLNIPSLLSWSYRRHDRHSYMAPSHAYITLRRGIHVHI